jgi:DNA replication protein DnaC
MPREIQWDPNWLDDEPVQIPTAADQAAVRLAAWEANVPRYYLALGEEALPVDLVAKATRWWTGQDLGLWLGGKSGRGKTALCWLTLARLAARDGVTWAVLTGKEALEATRGYGDQPTLHKARTVGLLILDEFPTTLNVRDIAELRDLLDRRNQRGLRTVITANYGKGLSADLIEQVGEAATALHNRLDRFSSLPFLGPELPRKA